MLQLSISKDQLAPKQRELNISRRCYLFIAKIILRNYVMKLKDLSRNTDIDLLTCKTELQRKLKIS